jgi:hypothetical protein
MDDDEYSYLRLLFKNKIPVKTKEKANSDRNIMVLIFLLKKSFLNILFI